MAPSHRNGGDRLSTLPDKALERVLSHLMSDEAVRTSGLSRRWRHVHEGVPVVRLVDTKSGERYGRSGGDLQVCFDHQVTSAIMGKGIATPIRAFRVTVVHPPYDLLDQWIATVVDSGVEDLDVKLGYDADSMGTLCPFLRCPILGTKLSADFDRHVTNRYTGTHPHIFGCPTLRRLRLTNWTLDLPGSVDMAALETLCLARIMDPHRELQQLISACPGLAKLTLEECPSIKEIAVTPARLRSFAMICCHHATAVQLQTTCLESLHYKGGLPPRGSSFITVANYDGVKAVRIEICEKLTGNHGCDEQPNDVAPVTNLIRRCGRRAYLHLSLRPSMACNLLTGALRGLDSLTHLSLQGCLPTDDAVLSVSTLLAEARNLEVLSLHPLGPEPPKKKRKRMHRDHDDDKSDSDSGPEDGPVDDGVKYSSRMPERLRQTYVRCLAHKVRRISIANFQGRPLEKMLARFLLSRAVALEEFSVTLAAGVHPRKAEITKELKSWRHNRRARVTCNLD
ncbi:unnamed protein product [Triticum aestivum]|uniref:F-box domain-containing protein n=1 Tax=Triticum aestivum TaxID=4565 RepID=A0A7H4LNQ4_WHEAT|nr:unnamed protein product [Triticum aestivum]